MFGTCSCSCLQPDAHSIADIWDRGPGKLQKTTSQMPNPENLTQCSFIYIYIYICAQLPFETTSKLPGNQEPSALLCLQPSAGRQLPAPRSVVLRFFQQRRRSCVCFKQGSQRSTIVESDMLHPPPYSRSLTIRYYATFLKPFQPDDIRMSPSEAPSSTP